ncbi:universal stress protein [Pseudomonas gingeri]
MSERPRLLMIAPAQVRDSLAFERTQALARVMNASVRLVAFVSLDESLPLDLIATEQVRDAREHYQSYYLDWLENRAGIMRGQGIEVACEVVCNTLPLGSLLDYLHRVRPDLVIKDAHDEPMLKRIFFTPQDWQLLRDSPVPVHVVTPTGAALPHKILAAVDVLRDDAMTHELNEQIIDSARRLAEQCRCPLHLLAVYDWTALYVADIGVGRVPVSVSPSYDERKSRFQHLADRHGIHKDHRHFVVGAPSKAIDEYVHKNAYDLLVIGSVTHRGLNKLLGSTAQNLLYQPPCSLLVVKPVEPATGVTLHRWADARVP